jgi:hypothetical protein
MTRRNTARADLRRLGRFHVHDKIHGCGAADMHPIEPAHYFHIRMKQRPLRGKHLLRIQVTV